MKDFLAGLHDLESRGFDPDKVHHYLASTKIERGSLEPYLQFRPTRYARNLVFKDQTYEVLVVCWSPGQRAPVHGHEGQYCWARVETGTLRFTNYRELSEKPLIIEKVPAACDGRPGYLDGPADIHEVVNPPSFSEPAASLHVYYHPFSECDVYDLTANEKRRVRLGYDTIEGRPVVDSYENDH